MNITRVGVDIAKSVFHVHGVDCHDSLQWQAKKTRNQWIDALCERVAPGAEIGRIIGFGVHEGHVDGPALCRMFNEATSGQAWPKYLSSDNDSLFQYHRWKATSTVLGRPLGQAWKLAVPPPA